MRGLPPFQALLLLITLALLAFAGSRYIGMGSYVSSGISPQAPPADKISCEASVEAEIELVFSSPPLSYTLTKPSEISGEDEVLLRSSSPIENPCYETLQVVSHELTSYWLDVVWPEDAEDEARHFVQIYISPDHGEGKGFCFFGTAKDMNETFEYNTGDHHHE